MAPLSFKRLAADWRFMKDWCEGDQQASMKALCGHDNKFYNRCLSNKRVLVSTDNKERQVQICRDKIAEYEARAQKQMPKPPSTEESPFAQLKKRVEELTQKVEELKKTQEDNILDEKAVEEVIAKAINKKMNNFITHMINSAQMFIRADEKIDSDVDLYMFGEDEAEEVIDDVELVMVRGKEYYKSKFNDLFDCDSMAYVGVLNGKKILDASVPAPARVTVYLAKLSE